MEIEVFSKSNRKVAVKAFFQSHELQALVPLSAS
jgi:hypothetical protein